MLKNYHKNIKKTAKTVNVLEKCISVMNILNMFFPNIMFHPKFTRKI